MYFDQYFILQMLLPLFPSVILLHCHTLLMHGMLTSDNIKAHNIAHSRSVQNFANAVIHQEMLHKLQTLQAQTL